MFSLEEGPNTHKKILDENPKVLEEKICLEVVKNLIIMTVSAR